MTPPSDVDGSPLELGRAIFDASEQDARLAVNSIPALIAVMTADGAVESVNRPLVEYLGQSPDELRRWQMTDAVHRDDLSRVIDTWTRSVATGQPYYVEHRIRRADGMYRWFQVRGQPQRDPAGRIVRWYNVILDIDEQKRAEDQLEAANAAVRASQRQLSVIIETIPALVWCADPEGKITYINQRILEFLDASFDAVAPRWDNVLHVEDREAALRSWKEAVTSGHAYSLPLRIKGKDGFYRWMQAMAQLGRDESGAPTGWYGVLIDIDEQKRAEQALGEMRMRLQRASQSATVAELAASIAHEVNQPLTAIVSNGQACANWIAQHPPRLENARRAAERVVRDATRAGEIVARLRSLFKLGPLHRVSLSINELISDVLELTQSEALRRRVLVRTDLDPSHPSVSADRIQMQQVVLNLVNNAMDAMDAIVTRTKMLLLRSARDPAGGIVLEVSDTGVGLDDATRVFDPFFTTKNHGMGMGLTISRSIVEAHGGHLRAKKVEPHGASFCVELPLQEPG